MNTIVFGLAVLGLGAAIDSPAPVEKQVLVTAPPQAVWEAWTTERGLTSFFAPAVNVDLRVGGAYEIFFFPDQPKGRRGAEETRLMAVEPPYRLAFTWDAPPNWPAQRAQRTMVEVRLSAEGADTRVWLRQIGFGDGPDWQAVRDYFDEGWGTVLARLVHRFEAGPVDWGHRRQSVSLQSLRRAAG